MKASVTGRVVIVEGTVEGDIHSEEQVVLRASARVQGDIIAPRLVLEDGARFRGGVDMGDVPGFGNGIGATPSAAKAATPASNSGAAGAASASGGKDSSKADGSTAPAGEKKKGSPELFAEART